MPLPKQRNPHDWEVVIKGEGGGDSIRLTHDKTRAVRKGQPLRAVLAKQSFRVLKSGFIDLRNDQISCYFIAFNKVEESIRGRIARIIPEAGYRFVKYVIRGQELRLLMSQFIVNDMSVRMVLVPLVEKSNPGPAIDKNHGFERSS